MKVDLHNRFDKGKKYVLKKIKKHGTYGTVLGVISIITLAHVIVDVVNMINGNKKELKDDDLFTANEEINPDSLDNKELEGQKQKVADFYATERTKNDWKPSGPHGEYQIVDVSSFQENVDIKELKENGVDGILIKLFDAYYMNYPDDRLYELDDRNNRSVEELIRQCEENDMPYGFYVFSRATTEDMAQKEAVKTLKFLSKYEARPTLPVYYDIEPFNEPLLTPDYDYENSDDSMEINAPQFFGEYPERVISNFKAFADVLENQGYYVGIYSNMDNGFKVIDPTGEDLANYALWISFYGETGEVNEFSSISDDEDGKRISHWIDPANRDVGLFQFTEQGHVTGAYDDCGNLDEIDMSYMYYNYPKLIIDNDLNIPLDYSIFEDPDFHYTDLVPNNEKTI